MAERDRVIDIVEVLETRLGTLSDEKLVAEAVSSFDSIVRALSQQEMIEHKELLERANALLLQAIDVVMKQQSLTRQEMASFNSNTQKLKAYKIPR